MDTICKLSFVVLLALTFSPLPQTNGAQNIDVHAEINKMAARFEKIEKPSPAMVANIVEQIRESCRVNKTLEESSVKSMSSCVDNLFNETALVQELQDSIPKGELDNVFSNICNKWPLVKDCLKPGFQLIDECWENGTLVNSGVDSMVKFFCGERNDGAYIALFFAEGGLSCLESHGDKIRDCINEHNTEEHQSDLCLSVSQVHECVTPLKKCNDSTPHNLVTSMVREVGRVMHCPPIEGQDRQQRLSGGSVNLLTIPLPFILAIVFFQLRSLN